MKKFILVLVLVITSSCSVESIEGIQEVQFSCEGIPSFTQEYTQVSTGQYHLDDMLEYISEYDLWVVVVETNPTAEIYVGEQSLLDTSILVEPEYVFYLWLDEPIITSSYQTIEGCYLDKITVVQ